MQGRRYTPENSCHRKVISLVDIAPNGYRRILPMATVEMDIARNPPPNYNGLLKQFLNNFCIQECFCKLTAVSRYMGKLSFTIYK